MESKKNKLLRISIHLFFWLMVFIGFIIFYGQKNDSYFTILYQLIITMPVYISATYFTIYFIIPRFLLKKQYLKSIIYFIYTSLAAIFFEVVIIIYGMFIIIWPEESIFANMQPTYLDAYSLIAGIHFVIILAVAIKVLKLWYGSQNRYQLLEQKKVEAELQFLKSQMHPHFLFNTLNNLYALTLKKSDQAPDVVLKISSILDYILYQCNDRVDLEKEIKLIEDYIELEKLRCADRCDVSFEVSGDLRDVQIMPLVFLPFVENAFKHGVSKNSEQSFVKIFLGIEKSDVRFTIENSYKEIGEKKKPGIGIQNVKARLDAGYDKKYSMNIDEQNGTFCVDLVLEVG